MICSICMGAVIWMGPASNLTHTQCQDCGEINCQISNDRTDCEGLTPRQAFDIVENIVGTKENQTERMVIGGAEYIFNNVNFQTGADYYERVINTFNLSVLLFWPVGGDGFELKYYKGNDDILIALANRLQNGIHSENPMVYLQLALQ